MGPFAFVRTRGAFLLQQTVIQWDIWLIYKSGLVKKLDLSLQILLESSTSFFSYLLFAGAGCMVGAICGSTEREPIVVGKPSTFMMEFLLQK